MTDNHRPSVGVAVLIWKDGKILLYERAGSHGHGTWSIPGGHLEYGESWERCARREVLEEIGVTLKNVRYLATTNDIFEKDYKASASSHRFEINDHTFTLHGFRLPTSRSTKVIGTSTTVRPALTARQVRSVWKQYPRDSTSCRPMVRSASAR